MGRSVIRGPSAEHGEQRPGDFFGPLLVDEELASGNHVQASFGKAAQHLFCPTDGEEGVVFAPHQLHRGGDAPVHLAKAVDEAGIEGTGRLRGSPTPVRIVVQWPKQKVREVAVEQ